MDVLILAGGRGTRLHPVWTAPKCLVPVGGIPLLERLLHLLRPLRPDWVELSLGHAHGLVTQFVTTRDFSFLRIVSSVSTHGTAVAVVRAVLHGYVGAPLLVLNGDTLPDYDLGMLVAYHEQRIGAWATIAVVADPSRWHSVYAGACVLSENALDAITEDHRTRDFPAHLVGAQEYRVPGFLDVGTPEGFRQAQEWKM